MPGFNDLKLNRQLLNALEDLELKEPTSIQQKAIPLALAGHDLMGIAPTGTGKTAAYLLPILMKIKFHQQKGPSAIILAPTRELAIQISSVAVELAKYTDIRPVAIYGGTGTREQIAKLKETPDLLIATPGRFMDFYLEGHFQTRNVNIMVLDEADRMMDMGFMPQINRILEVIPRKRQNLLFSATMASRVVLLSEEFLEFPQKVEIFPQSTVAETISQSLYYIPNLKTKINFLEFLLEKGGENLSRTIVFTRKKSTAQSIYKFIERKKLGPVRVLHANKDQNSRIKAMDDFRSGEIRVLVTTDVSSRGIDIEDIFTVINFDVPLVYEDYVHRIGRTGRAGKKGLSLTFCTESENYHIKGIEQLIRQEIPLAELPAEVRIDPTPFEEKQDMDREIDQQKRRENPEFKGAFHEKKKKNRKDEKRTNKGRKRR